MIRTLGFVLLLVVGCNKNGSVSGSAPSITQIDEKAQQIEGLKSLLISKNGDLIFEKYYRPYQGDSLDHVRSITKSIMGILIGIAIDQGYIDGVDTPISNYLSTFSGYRSDHEAIRIRHLLTMSGGFEWNEDGAIGFNEWVTSSDPVSFVLKKPIVSSPGAQFNYNSGGTHLLSVILTEATGRSTLAFAQKNLFEPLEVENVRWQQLGKYYNGGAGLELNPGDMIKIGELVNNNGKYQGKTVVLSQWISQMVLSQINVSNESAYGYLWWISLAIPEHNAGAIGYGGQYIIVVPEWQVTFVATSIWQGIGGRRAEEQSREISRLMADVIYPYLKDRMDE